MTLFFTSQPYLMNMWTIRDCTKAPVTGGNFVDLVQKGFYNNMDIQRSDGFVVQTGDARNREN